MGRLSFFAFVAASLFGAAIPVLAGESLLIGRVESILMLPTETPECPSLCPPSAPNAQGLTRVCISNDGGCQRTSFQVERVLLGDESVGPKAFSQRTGEWGQLVFPVRHDPILVYVKDNRVHWAALHERDGKLYFEPDAFAKDVIAGVAVSALAADDRGLVPLERLSERLPARR